MGAGTGFEPVIPQPRDYEPNSFIKVCRPLPPFWRLSLFSNFRASLSVICRLVQMSFHGPCLAVHFDLPSLC